MNKSVKFIQSQTQQGKSEKIESRSRANSGTVNTPPTKPNKPLGSSNSAVTGSPAIKTELNNSTNNKQQLNQNNQRRVRTQMTQYQVNVMRLIFAEYKTPTMNECEQMGKEINLKKSCTSMVSECPS